MRVMVVNEAAIFEGFRAAHQSLLDDLAAAGLYFRTPNSYRARVERKMRRSATVRRLISERGMYHFGYKLTLERLAAAGLDLETLKAAAADGLVGLHPGRINRGPEAASLKKIQRS